ncbi:MAG: HdeD family acid-resistance protein [Variovorax sp.]|nr:MAG: HdeD family acid-resistance protein [Variovorax sp.]
MAIESMFGQLRDNWGWVALRGVVAILFGVLAFAWPGATLLTLAIFWGAYVLADGVFAIIAGFRIRDGAKPVWPLVLIGLVGIVAGIATFVWPGLTAFLLLMVIAAWAIFMGVFQIVTAIRIRKEIDNEWMLILSGALSLVFGIAMVLMPGLGALAVVWTIATYAIVFGVLLLVLAFKLKGLKPKDRFAGR